MLKIAWVTLWLITPGGQSTTIVQYMPETGDPMERCEKTKEALFEDVSPYGSLASTQIFYLACVPVYVNE
jgi:hypothetical protein